MITAVHATDPRNTTPLFYEFFGQFDLEASRHLSMFNYAVYML